MRARPRSSLAVGAARRGHAQGGARVASPRPPLGDASVTQAPPVDRRGLVRTCDTTRLAPGGPTRDCALPFCIAPPSRRTRMCPGLSTGTCTRNMYTCGLRATDYSTGPTARLHIPVRRARLRPCTRNNGSENRSTAWVCDCSRDAQGRTSVLFCIHTYGATSASAREVAAAFAAELCASAASNDSGAQRKRR